MHLVEKSILLLKEEKAKGQPNKALLNVYWLIKVISSSWRRLRQNLTAHKLIILAKILAKKTEDEFSFSLLCFYHYSIL